MLENATAEQREMIQNTEGYQRVCAVPGSGKTFSLIHRMAYLITELYIDPSSIQAITFTNKAARQMTSRLKSLVGDKAECFTGTFHGKCNEILKEESYRLSWPKNFSILDKHAQVDLIRLIAEEQGISLKDHTAAYYVDLIAARKQTVDYVSRYLMGPEKTRLTEEIAQTTAEDDRMYLNYLLKQRENYVVDFQDLMMMALYILTHYRDALEKWQDRCQYLLCDEYQDVNNHQELLLELLSGRFHNLTVVGDDDQCIYGWRGSKVEYMIAFDEKYPNVRDFYLSRNFRSTPEIVDAANSLIRANQSRLTKKMYTENPHGPKPVYYQAKTEGLESLWIANTIQDAVAAGANYKKHCVLVRSASQTRSLEEAFVQKGIPYKILSGATFYGSEEIRTVLAYLRMIYSLNDLDFEWTIKRPRKGFGKKSLEKLKEYAVKRGRGMTLFQALGEQIRDGVVKRQDVIAYYDTMLELHETYRKHSCSELVNLALDLGYRRELQQDIDQKRLDNVTELLATISALEAENEQDLPLDELLAHFALFANQDDDTEKDAVKVMTIHTAKGLEFDTVFVCGLVEGQFPSKKLRNQDEFEEERRLFYVAMTRAIRKLYLSSYGAKSDFFPARQSSFLGDLDVRCLDCIKGSRILAGQNFSPIVDKAEFAEGDQVRHPAFGVGTIVKVDEQRQTYDIRFEKMPETVRRVLFRAPLERG